MLTGKNNVAKKFAKVDLKSIPIVDVPIRPKAFEFKDGYPTVYFTE